MFTLIIQCTLYTCLYILLTHVYPSHSVYSVFPCISNVPMFTLVILYTLYTPIYPVYSCLPWSFCIPCVPLNWLCREIMKLVKRIGVESNCGPLFQTPTRLPTVLLWIIMKIKFSIEKWWCTEGSGRQTRCDLRASGKPLDPKTQCQGDSSRCMPTSVHKIPDLVVKNAILPL